MPVYNVYKQDNIFICVYDNIPNQCVTILICDKITKKCVRKVNEKIGFRTGSTRKFLVVGIFRDCIE